MRGEYKVKNDALQTLSLEASRLARQLDRVDVSPRPPRAERASRPPRQRSPGRRLDFGIARSSRSRSPPPLLAAAAFRLPSLVSTLLAAYLALVANVGLVTLVLSPFHAVTAGGLAGGRAVLSSRPSGHGGCVGAQACRSQAGAAAFREAVADPLTVLMLVVVASCWRTS